jgi:hypothetical protein
MGQQILTSMSHLQAHSAERAHMHALLKERDEAAAAAKGVQDQREADMSKLQEDLEKVTLTLSERNAERVELTGDLSKSRTFLALEQEKAKLEQEEWSHKVLKP